MLCHEVDHFRRRHLRRNAEVALVLPVLVVDKDEHAALARLLDHFLYGGKRGAVEIAERFSRFGHSAVSRTSMRRAT
ncbi:hypothetical protein [Nisaea acidiphila]|uniref:hypothetical protein n=1 Tax=Nisaea acidiphila TaxID=1862145 RepID=UPI00356536F5